MLKEKPTIRALIGITVGGLVMYIGSLIARSTKLHSDASASIREREKDRNKE